MTILQIPHGRDIRCRYQEATVDNYGDFWWVFGRMERTTVALQRRYTCGYFASGEARVWVQIRGSRFLTTDFWLLTSDFSTSHSPLPRGFFDGGKRPGLRGLGG